MASNKVREVRRRIGVGNGVANELLVLAGGDVELVVSASKKSSGLDQCKAAIIDGRFRAIEEEIWEEEI